jgi:hypothetical protein
MGAVSGGTWRSPGAAQRDPGLQVVGISGCGWKAEQPAATAFGQRSETEAAALTWGQQEWG